jgi:tetratricopeptide (TPR) repeat protein
MRWIASLALFLVLTGVAAAAGPDDQYLDIYNEVQQADALQQDGQALAAGVKYVDAQTRLKKLKDDYPGWNTDVVTFRLQYLSDKLQALGKILPSTKNASVAAAATNRPTVNFEQQAADLQEQVRALTAERTELQNKLKEALSVQPAAVSPAELAKREEEIVALKKERDLLAVNLDQAKAAKTAASDASNSKLAADLAAAQNAAGEANKKLEEASRELAALKSAPAPVDATPITQERDKLKEELAARTKDLADAEAHGDQELLAVRAQLKEAQAQRDDLRKKLDDANAAGAASAANTAETEQLRARLAVLEAKAVPYTAEELAILNQPQSKPPGALPAAPAVAVKQHVAHSAKDLPPGSGPLMADAMRASMDRDFAQAEEKFKEILRQDENNVYVLAHLANAQFAEGHLEDCDKTVQRALALDPDDPASLYMLGILRYRQEKLDEALNALSRSAQFSATNGPESLLALSSTQNYLGCVLADKGMRPEAETAFRKALQLEPDYSDAHYNIAFVYATEKPPSPELARWHYKRAVTLGHAKNPKLETILADEK